LEDVKVCATPPLWLSLILEKEVRSTRSVVRGGAISFRISLEYFDELAFRLERLWLGADVEMAILCGDWIGLFGPCVEFMWLSAAPGMCE
jgi:hypothetical protein